MRVPIDIRIYFLFVGEILRINFSQSQKCSVTVGKILVKMTWVSFTAKRGLTFRSISKLFLKLPEVVFSSAVSDPPRGHISAVLFACSMIIGDRLSVWLAGRKYFGLL